MAFEGAQVYSTRSNARTWRGSSCPFVVGGPVEEVRSHMISDQRPGPDEPSSPASPRLASLPKANRTRRSGTSHIALPFCGSRRKYRTRPRPGAGGLYVNPCGGHGWLFFGMHEMPRTCGSCFGWVGFRVRISHRPFLSTRSTRSEKRGRGGEECLEAVLDRMDSCERSVGSEEGAERDDCADSGWWHFVEGSWSRSGVELLMRLSVGQSVRWRSGLTIRVAADHRGGRVEELDASNGVADW